MAKTERAEKQLSEEIDAVLGQIIDEWYQRVSPHYITPDDQGTDPTAGVELKFFHDEKGHRIKFNKHELDFTYGLSCSCADDLCLIEISVNNKVAQFNYRDFQKRLISHYQKMGNQGVPTPYELKNHCYKDIFRLEPSLNEAFRVEEQEGKADIMRLSFSVNERFSKELVAHPVSSRQLIEDYCVSPFRTVYAAVYRRTSH